MANRSRHLRFVQRLFVEEFEKRLCLSEVSFAAHDISLGPGASSVVTADLDGDGDADVISASYFENETGWYENTDGKGSFGQRQNIGTGGLSTYGADVDGDHDIDVISSGANKILWHENIDGKASFVEHNVITDAGGRVPSVYAVDVDGDGDVDVLSASSYISKISWYENTDGKGTFGLQEVIASDVSFAQSVYAADVDGDGDVDVVAGFYKSIAWYENVDGKRAFEQQEISNTESGWPIIAADVDGDGDEDVLAADFTKIAWYENLSPIRNQAAGDANRDGQFDQLDIVQVLQAAKYLTGLPATFEEGDWNSDGLFNQLDIIAALQTGNYLKGRFAARAVDTAFAALGS
jgi:hypothetical protein